MSLQECDPRALRVAAELHAAERPEITILFGSRARGDWVEGRSDIDILLVQERASCGRDDGATESRAAGIAQAIYGAPVPVQVVRHTAAEFERLRRSVNHVTAHAVREGVIMPEESEGYRRTSEADYDYEWEITAERLRHAVGHLHIFNRNIADGMADDFIGQQAQAAMEHALKALISAHDIAYPKDHQINPLAAAARRADPEFNFQPQINGAILDQYAGSDEYKPTRNPLTEIAGYQELLNADITAILERVRQVRQYPEQ